ncbi:MAG: hypothetical protein CMH49_06855 [Myxococcales bacterium]|nr:hypothetical protein [Myxococcales bacterium]
MLREYEDKRVYRMHKSFHNLMITGLIVFGSSLLSNACMHHLKQAHRLKDKYQDFSLEEAYATHQDPPHQISKEWLKCLAPFFNKASLLARRDRRQVQRPQNIESEGSEYCYSLLNRPGLERRPKFLNRDWLVINAREHMRPSLGIQSQIQRQIGPLKHSLNQGDWSLNITLIRLTPYQDQAQGVDKPQKGSLPKQHTPSPLKLWASAKVHRASLSEWTLDGIQDRPIPIDHDMMLSQLPTPRVGQVLHLELSQKAPKILRGAWAWHHQLWLNSPALQRSFTFNAPRAIKLSYFGDPAQSEENESYGHLLRWQRYFQASGEGGDLYISTMDTWSKLHNWLWKRFQYASQQYEKGLIQRLNASRFKYFLYPRNPRDIHRWLRQYFKYEPQSKTPYDPMPIADFLRSRQGDCKEFSTLAQVLLKLQGHHTFLALSSSTPIPRYALRTPSIGWFNHVLLWRPSEEALRLAELSADSQSVVSLGLTQHRWFDPTSPIPDLAPTGLAYVLLGPQRGAWISISQ